MLRKLEGDVTSGRCGHCFTHIFYSCAFLYGGVCVPHRNSIYHCQWNQCNVFEIVYIKKMEFLITLGGWIECLKIRLKRSMKDEKKNNSSPPNKYFEFLHKLNAVFSQ